MPNMENKAVELKTPLLVKTVMTEVDILRLEDG
jgi:hypothetical protein